jgi:hypothetical protein
MENSVGEGSRFERSDISKESIPWRGIFGAHRVSIPMHKYAYLREDDSKCTSGRAIEGNQ